MDLMRHIPWRTYHDEEHVADFQQAAGRELAELRDARDDFYKQLRPSTATWGLALYEREYGLVPDPSRTREQRLERWLAKKRGRSTTTSLLLEQTASDLTGLPAEVIEYPEEDRFEIWLELEPDNIPDLMPLIETVEEIKPAHLGMYFTSHRDLPAAIYPAAAVHIRTKIAVPVKRETAGTGTTVIRVTGCCHTITILKIGGVRTYG